MENAVELKNNKDTSIAVVNKVPVEIVKYLTFKIGKEIYGFDIQFVVDINRIQDITKVPHQNPYVMGVINLRGQIIPVVEIRSRFNKKLREYDDRTCIIVMDYQEYTVGVVVDSVVEVAAIDKKTISSNIDTSQKSKFMFGVTKINKKMVTLLDLEKFLFE